MCALTNLYGHVQPEKVCQVYNQQNDEALALTDFEVFLVELYELLANRFVYVRDGEFIEETLYLFKEKFGKLCAKQEGKPHYLPVKDKLMDYANFTYWEYPLEYDELETHISKHLFPQHEATGKRLADEPIYILPDKILEDTDDCHCGSKKTYKSCHQETDDKIRRLSEYREK